MSKVPWTMIGGWALLVLSWVAGGLGQFDGAISLSVGAIALFVVGLELLRRDK